MINNYPYSYPARNLINSIFGIWIYCFSFVSSVKLYLYMQVATFIVQKIMLDDTGLMYVCSTWERFLSVSNVLAQMVDALVKQPSPRLLKHIIRCYLRLTDNPSACDALRTCLPTVLADGTFNGLIETQKDLSTRLWLHQLLHNIAMASSGRGGPYADLNRIMGR